MQSSTISILLTLALILTTAGCGPPATPDNVQVIDLLDLLPPDLAMEFVGTRAPRMVWNFDRGLPEGWTAGPEGVKIVQRSDGIQLEAPEGLLPWLETRSTIDSLHYQKLRAVLGPLPGMRANLYYSFDDPPYFHPPNQFRKVDSGGAHQDLEFHISSPEALGRPIRAMRLYSGIQGKSAVIKQLILLPRSKVFLRERLMSGTRVALGSESRRCWRFQGDGTREITIPLPRNDPALTFALGTLRGSHPAELTVEIRQGEAHREMIVRRPFPSPSTGWEEVQADLSPWRGQDVTLCFSVTGRGPEPIRLIGGPLVKTVPEARRPSVLLIVIDAQRADRLSLYGHHRQTSPHLARLAGEGILFSTAAAPCSWTVPSVVSTFTGRFAGPKQLAEGHGRKMGDETTLAQRFSRAGYATAGFTANCLLTVDKGFTRGFDTWYAAPAKDTHPTAGGLNQRVLRWLRTHRGEETFCYVHYMDPHSPFDAPWPESVLRTGHGGGGLEIENGWEEGYIWPLVTGRERLDHDGVRHVGRLYERGSEYTDFQIGRLLAALRQGGLLEGAAVLVTADHGDELNDHGYWGHGSTLYQEVLHVPMILRLPQPGPEAGSVVHRPVSLVDVGPTLAAIAGLPKTEGWIDGLNMLQLPDARTLYSSTTAHAPLQFAIIRPPWKYVYFNRAAYKDNPPQTARARCVKAIGQPEEMLFNMEQDPGERQNLIGLEPEVEAKMRRRMEVWFAEAGSDLLDSAPQNTDAIDEQELERLRALGYVQ